MDLYPSCFLRKRPRRNQLQVCFGSLANFSDSQYNYIILIITSVFFVIWGQCLKSGLRKEPRLSHHVPLIYHWEKVFPSRRERRVLSRQCSSVSHLCVSPPERPLPVFNQYSELLSLYLRICLAAVRTLHSSSSLVYSELFNPWPFVLHTQLTVAGYWGYLSHLTLLLCKTIESQ